MQCTHVRGQDIALFLPTMVGSPEGSTGGSVFLAFHVNCPNRYLSEESINTARETLGQSPAYILGKIILVEQHVASEVGGGVGGGAASCAKRSVVLP